MSCLDIVIPTFGFGRHGGLRVLSELGTEWVRKGHRVRIMIPSTSEPPYFPTEAEAIRYEVDGRSRRRWWPMSSISTATNSMRSLSRALSQHARNADLVLANQNQTAWSVAVANLRGRRGYYVQAYEPDFYDALPTRARMWFRTVARTSYALPLRQVVNSPVYLHYPGIRAERWVPPGVDRSIFRPLRESQSSGPPVMSCIGRRESWKGTADVISAYQRLKESRHDLRLRIAFEVPDGTDLPPGADLVIPKNDSELADFYRSADVQVALGTIQLGAPHYPVIEAMACGVPVVTTGYLPATERNAWLVPPNDPAAVASAVEAVLDHPSDTAKRVADAEAAVRSFGWPQVAADLLESLLD